VSLFRKIRKKGIPSRPSEWQSYIQKTANAFGKHIVTGGGGRQDCKADGTRNAKLVTGLDGRFEGEHLSKGCEEAANRNNGRVRGNPQIKGKESEQVLEGIQNRT